MQVKWSHQAEDDLDQIVRYIFEFNPVAAFELEEQIFNATRTLVQFPDSGRLGQVFGTREWVVHPNYMIVYKITETAVLIAAVVHTKQRYP